MDNKLRRTKIIRLVTSMLLMLSVIFYVLSNYKINESQNELIKQQNDELNVLKLYSDNLESRIKLLEERVQKLEVDRVNTESYLEELSTENEQLKKEVEDLKKMEWVSFEATAYTAKCDGCTGITATGKDIRNQSIDHRVVAVDPNIIPLGSIVEIEGYGRFVAADTGGAIKGRKIDILHQSKKEAYQFGRRDVEVKIVKRG